MNFCQIYRADIADGIVVRVSLFVSGCSHRCKGCFNPEAWDENYGVPYTQETEDLIIKELNKPYIKGLSILGGEPLELCHIKDLFNLITRVKKELPDKDIWMYTGSVFEELKSKDDIRIKLLEMCDVLVDGPFIEEKKDLTLAFRGSSNQRIIDLKKSFKENKTVLFDI